MLSYFLVTWQPLCNAIWTGIKFVYFSDISVEDASLRGAYGEERYEKVDFQRAVRSRFLEMKQRETERPKSAAGVSAAAGDADSANIIPWFVVDSKQTIEDLHNNIMKIVTQVVDDAKNRPIGKLWV
jgi:dTMP kinase